MSHNVNNIAHYNFTTSDRLFIDTNIWLKLFGHHVEHNRFVDIYSAALRKILEAKCTIFIDALVISEFINVYSREAYKLSNTTCKFKDFRNSSSFKLIAETIARKMKIILKECTLVESGLTSLNINDLFNEYSLGNSDINDQVILELCKRKNLTLITHDGDFKGKEISILSANKIYSSK